MTVEPETQLEVEELVPEEATAPLKEKETTSPPVQEDEAKSHNQ